MQVLQSIDELERVPGPVALAIGAFDGLHVGHQEVIRAAQEHALQHRGTAVVMTFDPHPARLLRPESAPRLLTGRDYQLRLLSRMDIGWRLLCPFTAVTAQTSPEAFVESLVSACRPLGCISVGYTWTFGRNRAGNIHALMDLGQKHGFAVYGVPPIRVEGEVVSSTLIRDEVAAGRLDRASHLLGRPYGLFGTVISGRQLGRGIGFPTANIRPEADLLPPFGVYAVKVEIDGVWRPGVANLGVRPTVDDQTQPLLEVHVFDWTGDLYGRELEVRLLKFLRPETRFLDFQALTAQISRDAEQARAWLG
jgi:riboflavin kinase/FMN adenylyltransferase